jgi:thioredoxin 1
MEISAKELQEKINNGEKIIVDFHGLWCGPCKMMMPIYEKVAKNNETNVQMYTMDIDKNRDYVMSIGVRSVPTIKLFSDKKVSDTVVGVMGEDRIKSLINNLITG